MIWTAFKLSLLVTLVSTCVVVLLGTSFAFVLAKRKFRGREFLDAVVTLPLVLPPTVTGYYLIFLLGRRGIIGSYIYDLTGWSITFTWWAAVIAAAVMALPLMVKSARAAIESVNPQYEIASYTLGKSELETFFRITLPLASRGVFAGVVLSFARALGGRSRQVPRRSAKTATGERSPDDSHVRRKRRRRGSRGSGRPRG